MLPRVSPELRSTTCDLGLFNLANTNKDGDASNSDTNEFAVGQNFIRKYGLTMKYVVRKDSNDISLDIFLGNAEQEESLVP